MYVNIDGNVYYFERYGEGFPLLLLHGFTGSTKTWVPYMERLSKNFQVIAVDLPGHGNTKVKTPFSMKTVCEHIFKVMNKLGYETFHLLGYSMGGRTALSFTMYFPDCVEKLILESASPGLERDEERKERREKDEALCQMIEEKGLEAFVHYWENIPLFQSQKRLPVEEQQRIRQGRLNQSAEGLIQSLRYMGTGTQPSWWNDLATCKQQTLLIAGALDEKYIKINKKMEKLMPNASLSIVEQTGHAPHVEDVEKFGKIVEDFLLGRAEKKKEDT